MTVSTKAQPRHPARFERSICTPSDSQTPHPARSSPAPPHPPRDENPWAGGKPGRLKGRGMEVFTCRESESFENEAEIPPQKDQDPHRRKPSADRVGSGLPLVEPKATRNTPNSPRIIFSVLLLFLSLYLFLYINKKKKKKDKRRKHAFNVNASILSCSTVCSFFSTVVLMGIFHIIKSQKNPWIKGMFLKNSVERFLYKSMTYSFKNADGAPLKKTPMSPLAGES